MKIKRQRVVALRVKVLRRRLWRARSRIARFMASGVTGQIGPSVVRSVAQGGMTASARSRYSLSLAESHAPAQRQKRKPVRISHALFPVKCLIGKILESAPSVAEVGR
jgi:hypothetical protein